jgi:hypothetical protein
VTYEIASRCDGPIAEFGCGEGSTQLLHDIASDRGLKLVSLDTDPEWLGRYSTRLASPTHKFRLVDDWRAELASDVWDEPWGLVLIDQSPWEARVDTVRRLRDTAEYVVLHDCDYLPEAGLLGTSIRPLRGPDDVGERDWSDAFSSWREFFPLEPWPAPTGPPTLLASNLRDCDIEIDYADYLPSRPARASHKIESAVRGLLHAARVRLDIG